MAHRYSLLIADDDARNRERMGSTLLREGYRVLLVSRGLEAIEVVRVEEIHGLIIEMHMPDISGAEALQQMETRARRIPSIFISSEPWKEMQLEALDGGAFSFIQKPIEEDILRTSVARLLERCWKNF